MSRMPVLFVGHGTPMNAIEDNRFSNKWKELGKSLPKPKAILMISAHWFTYGEFIRTAEKNCQIYDMYGFPKELYEVIYEPKGDPELAKEILDCLGKDAQEDNGWGLDHGGWEVLVRMYPSANIPVIELSINANWSTQKYFEIGQKLKYLREKGVLIIGSGNISHNLSILNFDMEEMGYKDTIDFDQEVKTHILAHEFSKVLDYSKIKGKRSAFISIEHFAPIAYVLGAVDENDSIEVFNEGYVGGSLSMTSYLFK